MNKYLGLDLGTKTLGIAFSNGMIASNYDTIRYDGDYTCLINPLKEIINKEKITFIVLGLPKNMNNTIGPSGEYCIEFGKLLHEKTGVLVVMQDERLSTMSAHSYMIEADMSRKKRKSKVDELAASIILQTYLDIERGKKNER